MGRREQSFGNLQTGSWLGLMGQGDLERWRQGEISTTKAGRQNHLPVLLT